MDAREYLGRAWRLEMEVHRLIDRRSALLSQAMRGTGKSSAVRYGGTAKHSKVEEGVCTYMEVEGQIDAKIDELVTAKREIATIISRIPDETYKTLLMRRHVEFHGWSEIAKELRVSADYAMHDLHEKAIKTIYGIMLDTLPPYVV